MSRKFWYLVLKKVLSTYILLVHNFLIPNFFGSTRGHDQHHWEHVPRPLGDATACSSPLPDAILFVASAELGLLHPSRGSSPSYVTNPGIAPAIISDESAEISIVLILLQSPTDPG